MSNFVIKKKNKIDYYYTIKEIYREINESMMECLLCSCFIAVID